MQRIIVLLLCAFLVTAAACRSQHEVIFVPSVRAVHVRPGLRGARIAFTANADIANYRVYAFPSPNRNNWDLGTAESSAINVSGCDTQTVPALCAVSVGNLDPAELYTFVVFTANGQQISAAVRDVQLTPPGLEVLAQYRQRIEPPAAVSGGHFGAAFASGDIDGDGRVEIAIAATGGVDQGGQSTCREINDRDVSAQIFIYEFDDNNVVVDQGTPRTYTAYTGYGMAVADLNVDGELELAIGNPDFMNQDGRVEVFDGVDLTNETPLATLNGPPQQFALGGTVAAITQGPADMLVSASLLATVGPPPNPTPSVGNVAVITGNSGGPLSLLTRRDTLEPVGPLPLPIQYEYGSVLEVADPGYLVIGAPGFPGAGFVGGVHIYELDGTEFVPVSFGPAGENYLEGREAGGRFGHGIAVANRWDPAANNNQGGLYPVLVAAETEFDLPGLGPDEGRIDLYDLRGAGTAGPMLTIPDAPPLPEARLGHDVTAVDLNGDGIDEIVGGAPFGSQLGGSRLAATYIWYGTPQLPPEEAILWDKEGDSALGFSIHNLGDINGDGSEEMLIGAPCGDDDPSPIPDISYDSGWVYLQWGAPLRGPQIRLTDVEALAIADYQAQIPIDIVGAIPGAEFTCTIDWRDGSNPEVRDCGEAGEVVLEHTYDSDEVYHVEVNVQDSAYDPGPASQIVFPVCVGTKAPFCETLTEAATP